jgi:putative aldouronate transport system permease protein
MIGTKGSSVLSHIVLIAVTLIFVVPILAVVSISFMRESEVVHRGFTLWPSTLTISNYSYILKSTGPIVQAYSTSILVTILGTAISTILTILIAYPLSVKTFIFRRSVNRLLVVTLLFNGGMIPTYILMTQVLHLGNTIWGHIMPFALFPFYIVLLRTFLQGVPDEMRESANMDGASELRILVKIILPMSTPAVVAIVLLTSLRIWNDTWYTGMLYMEGNALRTLPMYLQQMMENVRVMAQMAASLGVSMGEVPKETARMAMCVITIGPLLLVFPFFQRYFAKGITLGAIKG